MFCIQSVGTTRRRCGAWLLSYLPINAIALPDQDDPASFGPLGVGRISFGPFLQAALGRQAAELLARWS